MFTTKMMNDIKAIIENGEYEYNYLGVNISALARRFGVKKPTLTKLVFLIQNKELAPKTPMYIQKWYLGLVL